SGSSATPWTRRPGGLPGRAPSARSRGASEPVRAVPRQAPADRPGLFVYPPNSSRGGAMSRLCVLVGVVGLLAVLSGCGSGKHEVTGAVSYDGADVPEGDIIFMPENKSVAPEGGKIKDGKYAVTVQNGKYRVEIRASKPTGKQGPMGPGD